MRNFSLTFGAFATLLLVSGCGPAKVEVSDHVSSNEVGILHTMEGNVLEEQAELDGNAAASQDRIQSQTIIHDQRKRYTGYPWEWWAYDWLPKSKVVMASLEPVTREWTADKDTGTTRKDDSIRVETANSIGYNMGATVQCRLIPSREDYYLSAFGGKPLSEVVDEIVWGYGQARAAMYFGKLTDAEALRQLPSIAGNVHTDMKALFEPFGIEVLRFGWIGGFSPDNENIQTKFTQIFTAKQDIANATNEQKRDRRQMAIERQRAEAERREALLLWNSRQGVVLRTQLDLREEAIKADSNFIERWDGVLSQIVPDGAGPFWFLGQSGIDRRIEAITAMALAENPELDALAAAEAKKAAEEAEARRQAALAAEQAGETEQAADGAAADDADATTTDNN